MVELARDFPSGEPQDGFAVGVRRTFVPETKVQKTRYMPKFLLNKKS
jgi:hypothetical protein